MIRVIALDLDDTLLRSDHTVPPHTLELLQQWLQHGHYVVIATGRPPRSIATSLPVELHGVPWICYNGAEIYENGRSIYQNFLSTADTRQIIEMVYALAPTCTVGLEIDNILYLNRHMDRPSPFQVANLIDVANQPSAKVLFFQQNADELAPLLAALPKRARVMLSDKYRLVQILALGTDKVEALRFLLTRWGLSIENVIAFGDDVNDVDMIRESGIGVAVNNAVPEVKAVADRITLSNDEDGVGLVLQELCSQFTLNVPITDNHG